MKFWKSKSIPRVLCNKWMQFAMCFCVVRKNEFSFSLKASNNSLMVHGFCFCDAIQQWNAWQKSTKIMSKKWCDGCMIYSDLNVPFCKCNRSFVIIYDVVVVEKKESCMQLSNRKQSSIEEIETRLQLSIRNLPSRSLLTRACALIILLIICW